MKERFWKIVLSHKNYNSFALVRSTSSAKYFLNVENLQKRALRFLLHDYSSSYEGLLKKSGKTNINVCNYRTMYIEIFRTLNNINPGFVKGVFRLKMANRPTRENYELNFEIRNSNQISLRYLAPKVSNSLPYHIKSYENLSNFKNSDKKLERNNLHV